MPRTHYRKQCPICGVKLVQLSRHVSRTHKTTITDWQLSQTHGLEATSGPGLRQGPYGSGAPLIGTGIDELKALKRAKTQWEAGK